jgi:hypothetical protein
MPSDWVKLADKVKAVCADYYDFSDKKKAGCGKCPIQSECHGKVMQSFNHRTFEGLNGWIVALNQAANKANGQLELSI